VQFIHNFEFAQFLDSVASLVAAFVLGALIGAERQYRQRTAGLRTTVLVAVGAAAFVDLAVRIAGSVEAVRVISYVVSGIGFLGAGVIMKEGMNVRGLNTAATLWCSAAVGACAGTDMLAEAALLTVFVIAGNTLLRPLVNAINRIPISHEQAEATYEVHLIAGEAVLGETRDALVERLAAAKYPVGDVEVIEREDDVVELVATLVSTSVVGKELDAVTRALAMLPGVRHASWEASTTD